MIKSWWKILFSIWSTCSSLLWRSCLVMKKGKSSIPYGGQIDILPTLEHLLGIKSNSFLQVGQDLLSPDHQETVAFRTANSFVTPKYTSYDGRTYYTESGLEISNLDEQAQTELEIVRQAASQQLENQRPDSNWWFDTFLPSRSSWKSWYRKYFLPQFFTNSAKDWTGKR